MPDTEEMSAEERIAALTRGYIAVVNYAFNNMHDKPSLFDIVMDSKRLADDAIDKDMRDTVLAEIAALPGNRSYYCDECGAGVNVDFQRS